MKLNTKIDWINIVYGVLFAIAGILIIVFAYVDLGVVDTALSIIIAVSLFVVGLIYLITSFVSQTKEFITSGLILGSMAIALGIVLLILPWLVGGFLVYFLAAFLVAGGAVALAKAITGIVFKFSALWILGAFAIAAAGITLGSVILAINGSVTKTIIYTIMGAGVFAAGIAELIVGIKLLSAKKKINKAIEDTSKE